jgi:signal transduction histidine kinase
MEKADLLYFGVEARHLRQLGRELIGDRTTALAELVKNAYDADATDVTLHFVDPEEGGTLEVRDDGEGMHLDAIKNRWMRLSTSFKDKEPVSPRFGRIRAGQKGIGRFATEALGKRLVLSSTVSGSQDEVVATFDWDAFDKPGLALDKVGSTYTMQTVPAEKVGTCLKIEGLRHAWTEKDLAKLRKTLLLLQPPFPVTGSYQERDDCGSQPDPGIEIKTRLGPGKTDEIEWVSAKEQFLDASTATVEVWVEESGDAYWRARSEIFGINNSRKYKTRLLSSGEFRGQIHYFVYDLGAIGNLGLKLAREMGADYGGVRIYRDGLRVPPYGNKGNDWLGLDELSRGRKVLFPTGNNNWFGYVSLSRRKNLLFVDTASREGVVENEAFEELRDFMHDALVDCGRQIAAVRGRKERAGKRTLPVPENRSTLVERVREIAREALAHASEGRHNEARASLDRAATVAMEARASDSSAQVAQQTMLDEVGLLRILAALGTSTVVFSHEVDSAINVATARLADIEEDAAEAPEPWRSQVIEQVADAMNSVGRLGYLAQYIEGYASQSRRRERVPQPLFSVLESFVKPFEQLVERRSVQIEWEVEPPNLRTRPMARSELDAVLINLLTNALKAIESAGGSKRLIQVTAEKDGSEVVLRFQDTGCGVPGKIRDVLFDAFVTTSLSSDNDLGLGTGIGLKIVHDIAQANRGSASLGIPDDGFSTCLEIRLPTAAAEGENDE